jgi:PAS domain S-box-containing protein
MNTTQQVDRQSALNVSGVFREAFLLAPWGILLVEQGLVFDANPALCRLLGADRAELVGRALEELVPLKSKMGEGLSIELEIINHPEPNVEKLLFIARPTQRDSISLV